MFIKVFRKNHKIYGTYTTSTDMSFWAMSLDGHEKIYLGEVVGDQIKAVGNLYSYPWDVYRNAEKLFAMYKASANIDLPSRFTKEKKYGLLGKWLHLY